MGELVRQDLFQLPGIIERPSHRDSNLAVKDTTRPRRASRNITELFIGIENDGNNGRRVSQESGADAPVRCLQRIHCGRCETLLRRPFKEHGEVRAQVLLKPDVQGGFFAPTLQPPLDLRVVRFNLERRLIRPDRRLKIAHAIGDVAQQQRRRRQLGVESHGFLKRRAGLHLLPLEVRGKSRSQEQRGIVSIFGDGIMKQARRLLDLTGPDRLPPLPSKHSPGRLCQPPVGNSGDDTEQDETGRHNSGHEHFDRHGRIIYYLAGKHYLAAVPGWSIGRRIWKEVPCPTSLSTVIWPRWASTTSLVIFVPKPVPLFLLLMARAVKRRSRISGGMPFPLSATDRSTVFSSGSTRPRTVMEPPEGTSGIALLSRL